jgi:hypothetical protein
VTRRQLGGLLQLRFKAKRGAHPLETFTATIDSGADRTVLNLDTGCALGLDTSKAPVEVMKVPGGVELVGYHLDDVRLTHRNRTATLGKVFVAVKTVYQGKTEDVPRNDEQLIGHDFLQATEAVLDYRTHTLQGTGKAGGFIAQRAVFRPATAAERRLLTSVKACPIPRKRKKRRGKL